MKRNTHFRLSHLAALLLLGACGISTANADFVGAYTLDNWTLVNSPAFINGSVSPSTGDATMITLTSDTTETGGFTDFFITVPLSGTISFDWFFVNDDLPAFETSGYVLNGARTELSLGGLPSVVVLPTMVAVVAGDVFGFYVESLDGIDAPGMLEISNFSAPVPLPAAIWLLGSALLGLGVFRRRTA